MLGAREHHQPGLQVAHQPPRTSRPEEVGGCLGFGLVIFGGVAVDGLVTITATTSTGVRANASRRPVLKPVGARADGGVRNQVPPSALCLALPT